MTALADKMKSAGIDTLGSKLVSVCTEGVRQYPKDPAAAWQFVGRIMGYALINQIMEDMQNKKPSKAFEKIEAGLKDALEIAKADPIKPYQPRVIPKERLEKRRELQQIVRSKYKNSGGIAWSDVSCHEGAALQRDGIEVAALLAECPPNMPNDGRTFGDVLGVKRVDQIIGQLRAA